MGTIIEERKAHREKGGGLLRILVFKNKRVRSLYYMGPIQPMVMLYSCKNMIVCSQVCLGQMFESNSRLLLNPYPTEN